MNTGNTEESGWYEVRLHGRLDPLWSTWLDGMEVTTTDGTTVVRGHVEDQSALHGLLSRLGDIGVRLISVAQLEGEPHEPIHPHTPQGE